MLIKDMINARLARQHVNSIGFHFDSTNLQDSRNTALSGMVLHFGHIGQDFYYRLGYE